MGKYTSTSASLSETCVTTSCSRFLSTIATKPLDMKAIRPHAVADATPMPNRAAFLTPSFLYR